jgi:phosphoribosylformimino-5-aminoimidazole carboxamide ribotide isomerase
MQVIPVLDLLDAHAVRAVRGQRASYRPIQSTLCAGSEPLAVARALLAVTGASVLYVADLAAILGQGDHAPQLAALLDALGDSNPGVEIWLDAGYTDFASMHAQFERIDTLSQPLHTRHATLVPVFGTETLRDPEALREAAAAGFSPLLSLDHRAGALLADPAAESDTSWWPPRVIVMTLDHVGTYQGPDLGTLAAVRARAGERRLIGAGGIRHAADLSAAANSGAAAWLVASALHDGQLEPVHVAQP